MKAINVSLAALALVAGAVCAAPADDAEQTLREGMGKVLAVTSRSQGGRALAEELEPILEPRICFAAMTRRAVGPGWKTFTPDEQSEATRLFTKLIIRNYSNKFTPGQQPEIKYLKPTSPAADKVEIPTSIVYNGSRYTVSYRLENSGKWLVTDILAEGVSLVANYRAQLGEQFSKGGASGVLGSLKQSVAQQR